VADGHFAGLQPASEAVLAQLALHSGSQFASLHLAGSQFASLHFAGSQFAQACFAWAPGTGAIPSAASHEEADGHFEQSFTASVRAFFSFFSFPWAVVAEISTKARMTRAEIPKMYFFITVGFYLVQN
jgi:hypothetical protein